MGFNEIGQYNGGIEMTDYLAVKFDLEVHLAEKSWISFPINKYCCSLMQNEFGV